MTAGEAACREGGVIIIAASCSDGHGGESFYRNLAEAASPEELPTLLLSGGLQH